MEESICIGIWPYCPCPFVANVMPPLSAPSSNSPIRSSFELALLMHTHKSDSLYRLFVCSSSFFLLWASSWDPPIAQSASPKEDLIAYAPLASPPIASSRFPPPGPLTCLGDPPAVVCGHVVNRLAGFHYSCPSRRCAAHGCARRFSRPGRPSPARAMQFHSFCSEPYIKIGILGLHQGLPPK